MTSSGMLCIFTPTYNRSYCLAELFNSLARQTMTCFNWLIVDDGSTDNTEELVSSFMEQAPFRITYIKQPNGGKQRAWNAAVEVCDSELFMCVDSDDVVPDNLVSTIVGRWSQVRGDNQIAGMIGLCGRDEKTALSGGMPSGVTRTTMWDLYYRYGHKGDTAQVYRTCILREFPFEVEPGEKFIAETFVFHQIDQKYNLLVIDEVLIIREYLEDGYTANVRKITRNNPVGYLKLKRMYIGYADSVSLRFYETILYLVGCHFANWPHPISSAPSPVLAALAWLPAQFLCHTVYRER